MRRFWTFTIATILVAGTVILGPGRAAAATSLPETVTVGAAADIFAAGAAAVPPLPGGGGTMPVEVDVQGGATLSFSASGQVSCGPPPTHGADGAPCDYSQTTNIDAYGGISGVVDNTSALFLVGVFLGPDGPTATAPPALDFSPAQLGQDFTTLSPELQQTFFIGDGQTGGGTVQQFTAPAGATRLFLGFADADYLTGPPGYYGDNSGSLQVTVAAGGTLPGGPGSVYAPDPYGYQWLNPNNTRVTYDDMASDYPSSSTKFPWGWPTLTGEIFYNTVYKSFMEAGLCYGMAASSTYFYNDSPLAPLDIYDLFHSASTAMPFPFDGNNDVPIVELVQRYHSRQLAEYGAYGALGAYGDATGLGNVGVWQQVRDITAGGRPIALAIVPKMALMTSDPGKWTTLFNNGHVVVGYATYTDPSGDLIIQVYDPNAPGDSTARLTVTTDGRVTLYNEPEGYSYGSGWVGGQYLGTSDELQITPLPDASYLDGSSGSHNGFSIDNKHWILDLEQTPIPFLLGAAPNSVPTNPVFIGAGEAGSDAPRVELLGSGQSFQTTVTTALPNSAVGEFDSGHVVLAQEAETTAGLSHEVAIDPSATSVVLSGASATEHFDLTLGGDHLPTYAREFQVGGVALAPGASVTARTDPGTNALVLTSTGASSQVPVVITEVAQAGSSASVTAQLPGSGAVGTISVYNWADPAHSLVYETVTSGTSVKVLILQDNPAQRAALIGDLFQQVSVSTQQVVDHGLQTSLESKLSASRSQYDAGEMTAAENVLTAFVNEVTAQDGKGIDHPLAVQLILQAEELRGFLAYGP